MAQQIFIGGSWVSTSKKIPVRNPFDQSLVDEVFVADKTFLEKAVLAATDVFHQTRKLLTHEKSRALRSISSDVEKNSEDFARTIALESGKPLKYARAEVSRAVNTFRMAAETLDCMSGEVMPLDITPASGNRLGIIKRYPIGPVFGVSPFNFPLNLVAHKVAPALAAGCPIVLKPASATPLTALKLARAFDKTDLPKSMLQVIPCDRETADLLIEDPRFAMISFTGSPSVGWEMKKRAGKKKVVLELGGDAAVYIHKDADIESAVAKCLPAAFGYAGQVCISVQRIVIHDEVYDKFTKKFLAETKKLKVGNPLDEDTEVGPMIDEKNKERILEWIKEAVHTGTKVLAGNTTEGKAVVHPTVLEAPPAKCRIAAEEAFGPIVNIYRTKSAASAFELINSSKFGLQTGVFTNNQGVVFDAFDALEVGGVIINDVPTFRVDNMPYGGVKDSGFGREGVRYAIEDMTELKILVINRNHKMPE